MPGPGILQDSGRLTMTSNAEDQANPPAAATVEPPKAAKRANVAPQKRRVAPTKLNMLKTVRRQQAAQ